jgi:hypothetical protein
MAVIIEKAAMPDELKKFEKMEGLWVSDEESAKTKENYKKACDGFCYLIDLESENASGILKGHGFIFYDKSIEKFRLQWYDNFSNYISGEGNFTDDFTFILIEKFNRNIERHTEKFLDGGRKLQIIENFENGEFKKVKELSFFKKK